MAWTETSSLSFTARHEAGQSDAVVAVLEALEEHKTRLELLFTDVPGEVTVVLHDSALQLALAQPYLALGRRLAARAGRRYMAGWFTRDEVHVLSPSLLRRRAGGEGSLEALMLSPVRTYTMLVVGLNNPRLPPPFAPRAMRYGLRRPWLGEGAAQYFSGQLPHLRAAISRRLREGAVPFPPGLRDAPLLAGTLFDLLARDRGEQACVALATSAADARPEEELARAFDMTPGDLAYAWRSHLEHIAAPRPA